MPKWEPSTAKKIKSESIIDSLISNAVEAVNELKETSWSWTGDTLILAEKRNGQEFKLWKFKLVESAIIERKDITVQEPKVSSRFDLIEE